MSTPIFDELEEKWNWTFSQRAICDQYWTVTHTATGQEWFEDDEGNEVFLEELEFRGELYTVVREPNQTVIYNTEVQRLLEDFDNDCPVALVPKRKFKLFGRNQGTNGTL